MWKSDQLCDNTAKSQHALQISFSWKSHENVLKKPMNFFFMATKTAISDFMVLNYVMKFPWNPLPVIFMNHEKFTNPWIWIFMGHESLIYFMKRQLQPSMYYVGDEISNSPWNSHEGTIKNPWKCPTHSSTKVDINALENCCTHLLIRNSSCQICLNVGNKVHDDTYWWKKNLCY